MGLLRDIDDLENKVVELQQEIERLTKMGDTQWISVDEQLPDPGKYVIGKHNRGTWIDINDQENVNTVVVSLEKGLSMKDRVEMKDCDRKRTYTSNDEDGNNLVPYSWHQFGSDHFFGQSITYWMYIPKISERQ